MNFSNAHQPVGFQILIDSASQKSPFMGQQEERFIKKSIVGLFSEKKPSEMLVSEESLNDYLAFDGCPAGC